MPSIGANLIIGGAAAKGSLGIAHVYNNDPAFLATWRAARAGVLAGSANAKVLYIGDSKPLGAGCGTTDGSTFLVGAAALNKTKALSDLLVAAGFPVSRQSVIPMNGLSTIALQKSFDARVTGMTNWVVSSGTFISLAGNVAQLATANVDNFSFSPAGIVDTVDVLYIQGATVGHFTLDDGGATLVDVNGAGTNLLKRVSQALSSRAAGKTINLKRTTAVAQSIYIAGIIAYDSTIKSIELINAGRFGSKTADWNVTAQPWSPVGAIGVYAPKLTFIALGANDLNTGVAPATGSTNLQALVTAAKVSGDVVIVNPATGQRPAWGTAGAQAAWRDMLLTLAIANNCPMIDEDELWGGYTGDSTKYADSIHETAPASALEAVPHFQLMAA